MHIYIYIYISCAPVTPMGSPWASRGPHDLPHGPHGWAHGPRAPMGAPGLPDAPGVPGYCTPMVYVSVRANVGRASSPAT